MRRTPALATLVLAAGLAFTGCSTSSPPEEEGSSPSSSPSAEAKVRYDLEQAFYAQTPYGSEITVDFTAPAPEDIEAYRQAAGIEPGSYAQVDLDNREGTDRVGIYKVVFYDEAGKAYKFDDVMNHVSEWQVEENYDSENPEYYLPDGTAIPEAQYRTLYDQWFTLQDEHLNDTGAEPYERSTGYIASAETQLPEQITAIEVWPGGIIEDPIYMVPVSEKDGYEVPPSTEPQAPQSDEEAEAELQQWKDDGADCADEVLAELGPKTKLAAAVECVVNEDEDLSGDSLEDAQGIPGPPETTASPSAPSMPGGVPNQDFTYDEAYAAWQDGMPYYDAFCIHYEPTTDGGRSQCEGIEAGTVNAITGEYIGD